MRILITNDDGIDSPGIHELARYVEQAGHEVVVVAPDFDASGTATSIGRIAPDTPIRMRRAAIDGLNGEAYSLAGPPALCVVAGFLEAFGPKPDVVVSGINAGLNTGRSTLHSGTVGAALTAQNFGLRGLAVSLETADPWHWDTAAALTLDVLPQLLAAPPRSAVNLNVPARPLAEVAGIRWTGLAEFNSVRSAVSKVEGDYIHFDLVETQYNPEETTDLGAIRAGFASLTALHGNAEVWGPGSTEGDLWHEGHDIHAASVGHELRPAASVLAAGRDES